MAGPLGTISELRAQLDGRKVSSRELTDAALARAEALEPALHAFVGLRPERARAEAVEADARMARGERRSALEGIPAAIKDNMVQAGEPTTCASRILAGFVSPYDATVVTKLRCAGAVIIGRTNLDEFAMGSSTENSAYGPSRNPWDLARTPGGSSGGSAAAVAAGIVPLALGSDTGGSIRQPAACTGIAGMKPTYGRVSRYGLVAFASSLDQIGTFTRSAADSATALEVLCGHDPHDSTVLPEPVPEYTQRLSGEISGLVIGLPREYLVEEGVDPAVLRCVREAVAELERCGAKTREVSLPHTKYAIATYYLIATAEASSNLARYDGVRYGHRAANAKDLGDMYRRTRSEGFGAEVKRRILLGTYVLSAGYYDAYYRKASQVRTLIRLDFLDAFEKCDAILAPVSPIPAFRIGEKFDDPLQMYLSDVFTLPASLAGIPGISVPCGFTTNNLPIGLQILGPHFREEVLLRIAYQFEQATPFHLQRAVIGE